MSYGMNGNMGMGMGMPPNQQIYPPTQIQMQPQNQQGNQVSDKRGRRTRTDTNDRNYICGCGKSYLSYPALYTHVRQKHNGVTPQDTQKPVKSRGHRGRPINVNPQQVMNH